MQAGTRFDLRFDPPLLRGLMWSRVEARLQRQYAQKPPNAYLIAWRNLRFALPLFKHSRLN